MKFCVEDIKKTIEKGLPGTEAHLKMIPPGRMQEKIPDNKKLKSSAVLILIYKSGNEMSICLMRRHKNMKHHPGQISFPGGRCELHETNPLLTALRESHEEIGIEPASVKILGKLSDLQVSVSGFIIHPYLGYSETTPNFTVNTNEVDELITFNLNEILNQDNIASRRVETTVGLAEVPCYLINGYVIWGATSMMIAELAEILKQCCSRRGEH